jgi:hypothetical protein
MGKYQSEITIRANPEGWVEVWGTSIVERQARNHSKGVMEIVGVEPVLIAQYPLVQAEYHLAVAERLDACGVYYDTDLPQLRDAVRKLQVIERGFTTIPEQVAA